MKVEKELPTNMTGHIIVFNDPLLVRKLIHHEKKEMHEGKEMKFVWEEQTDEVAKCHYMRVEGGFGSHACCSGRMIIGKFFKSLQDVKANKIWESGNTKEYPDGYIPELFTEHEKL